MALTTDKIRISLYLDKELKDWIQEQSTKKNRSMSNYIETILTLVKEGKIKVDDSDI